MQWQPGQQLGLKQQPKQGQQQTGMQQRLLAEAEAALEQRERICISLECTSLAESLRRQAYVTPDAPRCMLARAQHEDRPVLHANRRTSCLRDREPCEEQTKQ